MNDIITKILRSVSFKFIVIGILSLLLLIPAGMIKNLIAERESRNQSARAEISEKWGRAQTITGPFLTLPVNEKVRQGDEWITLHKTLHLLPENLEIKADVEPLEKRRGIFRAVVYTTGIQMKGAFDLSSEEYNSLLNDSHSPGKPRLELGISDLRGILTRSVFRVNSITEEIKPGLYNQDVAMQGIHVPVELQETDTPGKITFRIDLSLNGSSALYFTPVGKSTDALVKALWPDPSFTGNFLPSDKSIGTEKFSAQWSINNLNRNYPQAWFGSRTSVEESAFGVIFLKTVGHYQKSTRAAKYAFMFIALTFLVFFLIEVISKTRIHPIQYLLVGFALIIFYTLLLSLSEHTGFNIAYGISTIATTVLVSVYIRTSLDSKRIGIWTGILLLVLYGYLFTILQVSEFALLMGSIGLFVILAVIMIVSRKINWYRRESSDISAGNSNARSHH